MNRKIEDKLIDLAFGEITPDEAKRLELQAATDPDAAYALQEYREMREGLRAMAEVPEHQLSNERLRDAILARGLAKKSPESTNAVSRGWVWMPIAACAMAFTMVVWRNTAPPSMDGTQIVGAEQALDRVAMDAKPLTRPFQAEPKVVIKEVPVEVVRTKTVYVPADVPSAAVARTARKENRRKNVGSAEKRDWVATKEPSSDTIILRANEVPMDEPPVVMEEQPIILIAQERDADTGAQVATEVESASNVLVGG